MKYLLIIGDGMADYPLPELDGRTPLEVAPTPNLDRLASESGLLGMVRTIPRGTMAASDTAFLSILGLDPRKNHPGRGPLEAVNLGLRLTEAEVAFRLNLVTQDEKKMVDSSAGHISDGEAGRLMAVLQEHFQGRRMRFVPGKSYRNLLIMERPPFDWRKLVTTPPHDILGRPLTPYLPKGPGSEFLVGMMEEAARIFAEHPINKTRIDLGENPANLVWPWGQGGPAELPAFQPRYGLTGFTVSAVDIVKGIGLAVGLEAVNVPGATGYLDTNYAGKVEAAIEGLKRHDFGVLHVEAPDETSHSGQWRLKVKAITDFDQRVVGPAVNALRAGFPESRVMVMADHITSLRTRTHTPDPIPFLVSGTGVAGRGAAVFSEKAAGAGRRYLREGWRLMEFFLRPELP